VDQRVPGRRGRGGGGGGGGGSGGILLLNVSGSITGSGIFSAFGGKGGSGGSGTDAACTEAEDDENGGGGGGGSGGHGGDVIIYSSSFDDFRTCNSSFYKSIYENIDNSYNCDESVSKYEINGGSAGTGGCGPGHGENGISGASGVSGLIQNYITDETGKNFDYFGYLCNDGKSNEDVDDGLVDYQDLDCANYCILHQNDVGSVFKWIDNSGFTDFGFSETGNSSGQKDFCCGEWETSTGGLLADNEEIVNGISNSVACVRADSDDCVTPNGIVRNQSYDLQYGYCDGGVIVDFDLKKIYCDAAGFSWMENVTGSHKGDFCCGDVTPDVGGLFSDYLESKRLGKLSNGVVASCSIKPDFQTNLEFKLTFNNSRTLSLVKSVVAKGTASVPDIIPLGDYSSLTKIMYFKISGLDYDNSYSIIVNTLNAADVSYNFNFNITLKNKLDVFGSDGDVDIQISNSFGGNLLTIDSIDSIQENVHIKDEVNLSFSLEHSETDADYAESLCNYNGNNNRFKWDLNYLLGNKCCGDDMTYDTGKMSDSTNRICYYDFVTNKYFTEITSDSYQVNIQKFPNLVSYFTFDSPNLNGDVFDFAQRRFFTLSSGYKIVKGYDNYSSNQSKAINFSASSTLAIPLTTPVPYENFTIAMWIKGDFSSDKSFLKIIETPTTEHIVNIQSDVITFDSVAFSLSPYQLTKDNWNYLAIVKNSTDVAVYMFPYSASYIISASDRYLIPSFTYSPVSFSGPIISVELGAGHDVIIDDFMLFNNSLNKYQIRDLITRRYSGTYSYSLEFVTKLINPANPLDGSSLIGLFCSLNNSNMPKLLENGFLVSNNIKYPNVVMDSKQNYLCSFYGNRPIVKSCIPDVTKKRLDKSGVFYSNTDLYSSIYSSVITLNCDVATCYQFKGIDEIILTNYAAYAKFPPTKRIILDIVPVGIEMDYENLDYYYYGLDGLRFNIYDNTRLEFDYNYTYTEGTNPSLLMSINDGVPLDILQYSVDGDLSGVWHRIKIPLSEFGLIENSTIGKILFNYSIQKSSLFSLDKVHRLVGNIYLFGGKSNYFCNAYSGTSSYWKSDIDKTHKLTNGNSVCNDLSKVYNTTTFISLLPSSTSGYKCCGDDTFYNGTDIMYEFYNGDENNTCCAFGRTFGPDSLINASDIQVSFGLKNSSGSVFYNYITERRLICHDGFSNESGYEKQSPFGKIVECNITNRCDVTTEHYCDISSSIFGADVYEWLDKDYVKWSDTNVPKGYNYGNETKSISSDLFSISMARINTTATILPMSGYNILCLLDSVTIGNYLYDGEYYYNITISTPNANPTCGGYVVVVDSLFRKDIIEDKIGYVSKDSILPIKDHCCMPDQCWNGVVCLDAVDVDYSNGYSSNIYTYPLSKSNYNHADQYICLNKTKAEWKQTYFKKSPYVQDAETPLKDDFNNFPSTNLPRINYGYCLDNTQCWNSTQCVNNRYVEPTGNYYCDGGTWSTNAKFMLEVLINISEDNGGISYAIYCDKFINFFKQDKKYNPVLNVWWDSSKRGDSNSLLLNQISNTNNVFCVYQDSDKTVVLTSLIDNNASDFINNSLNISYNNLKSKRNYYTGSTVTFCDNDVFELNKNKICWPTYTNYLEKKRFDYVMSFYYDRNQSIFGWTNKNRFNFGYERQDDFFSSVIAKIVQFVKHIFGLDYDNHAYIEDIHLFDSFYLAKNVTTTKSPIIRGVEEKIIPWNVTTTTINMTNEGYGELSGFKTSKIFNFTRVKIVIPSELSPSYIHVFDVEFANFSDDFIYDLSDVATRLARDGKLNVHLMNYTNVTESVVSVHMELNGTYSDDMYIYNDIIGDYRDTFGLFTRNLRLRQFYGQN
jgi:hypothetical protein